MAKNDNEENKEVTNTNKFSLNITSTLVEKGIDVATGFLGKLLSPAIEESGLLIKDQVSKFRFNNQIKMLSKAKAKCEKYGISPKQISLKLLVPILEYSSLEEDEVLIDKWANLLSNMVDSEQNLQNHVFPSILSQLSINEFNVLSEIYDERTARDSQLAAELKLYKEGKPSVVANYESDINQAKIEVKKYESQLKAIVGTTPYFTALSKLKSLENELKNYVEIEETYIAKLKELGSGPKPVE